MLKYNKQIMTSIKDLNKLINHKLKFLDKDDIDLATKLISKTMMNSLLMDKRIEIRGFGSFSLRKRKYANKNQYYRTLYYRMSQHLHHKLNK